jgi:LacI family transcriptional regulator
VGEILTIEEVALLARVSRSTVSRVLNNHPNVRQSVRDRVLEVMREHNYAPQAAARSLASSRTDAIGLLIPRSAGVTFSDQFISAMIQALVESCNRLDYVLMLAMVTADMEPSFYRRVLRGRYFDGIIMLSSDIDDPILPLLIRDEIPLVLIGSHPYLQDDLVSVDIENCEGGRQAVRHLIGLGHRRIGLINGLLQMEVAQARRDGYKRALLDIGISIDQALMVEGYFTQEGGYRAMRQLLELADRPTAVFVASDTMAVGALRAIYESGLSAPEDIAVVGFDDLPLALYTKWPLTTVHQPIADVGATAVELLIERMKGAAPVASVRLPTRLVIRESCGASLSGHDKERKTRLGVRS